MALVPCKECGNEISKKAKTCPKCGAKPKRTSFAVKFLLVIFGLMMFGFVQKTAHYKAPVPQSAEEKAAKDLEDELFRRASIGAITLKKAMRNPDSFKLESVSVVDKTKAVCYEYRAQNGFGGTNVEQAVLAPDGKTFKGENMSGFTELWNKECYKKRGYDYTGRVNVALKYQD